MKKIKARSIDIKRMKRNKEFAKLAYHVWKETGIHPNDYQTIGEYFKFVLSKATTESLEDMNINMNDESSLKTMIKEELKTRGEI